MRPAYTYPVQHDAPIPGIDRPLTPEECKKLAQSFADLPPPLQLTAEDCEMVQEEEFGQPMHYGLPELGAAAMQRRLAVLKAQKAKALATLDDCGAHLRKLLLRHLDELNRQIATAQQRLDGYQFQQGREN